jgi:hypothetical protein
VKLLVYHGWGCSRHLREAEKKPPMKTYITAASGLLLIVASLGLAAVTHAAQKPNFAFGSNTPAGYEVMQLKPSGDTLSLMGLIECPEIEGVRQISQGINAKLISANGEPIKAFPQHFSFRVTASLRKVVLDGPVVSVNVPYDSHDLLLKLKFRVRAYHGLDVTEIAPESIEMIGVPADVPYDERVYRVNMNVSNLPASDRLVLEVLSPQDEVLTHFLFNLL